MRIYNREGSEIKLDIRQEEMITYWCQTIGTEWEAKQIYRNNFSKMFKESF